MTARIRARPRRSRTRRPGTVQNTVLTGNTIYSPAMTAANSYGFANGVYGTLDPSNTISATGAPTPNTTPPIAWPPPARRADAAVTANGFPLPTGSTPAYTYPERCCGGTVCRSRRRRSAVTADQTTGATQTITYQVPVIPGALQFFGGIQTNPQCCLFLVTQISATAGSATVTVKLPEPPAADGPNLHDRLGHHDPRRHHHPGGIPGADHRRRCQHLHLPGADRRDQQRHRDHAGLHLRGERGRPRSELC